MNLCTKRFVTLLLAWSFSAVAQTGWPTRPIKVVVPYPAGGYYDLIARSVGHKMSESLGQPVLVENRAGANAIVGTEFTAKSPPDGYTIMVGGIGPHAINVSLYPKLPYDAVRDFAPIVHVSNSANALVVPASVDARSLQELVSLARAKPGEVSYASNGAGSSVHLCAEMLASMLGLRLNHIPFKGSAPAVAATLGAQVHFTFATAGDVLPHIRAGKLRPLAVTTTKRIASLPDVPTMIEAGVPDYEAVAWFAYFAPAATPPGIIAKLNQEINRALRVPDVHERLSGQGSAEIIGGTPEQLARLRDTEIEKWGKVIKSAGVKLD